MAKFEILRSQQNQQFFWHLVADNGKRVAWSGETYVNKADCLNILTQIKQNAATIPIVDAA